jgi:tRNA A-37 threonylcarbamoyl transferase component Bud32
MSFEPLKDGIRSQVRIDFYGNVHKRLRGTAAASRYATEVAVLKELENRGCPYVPRLLEEHPEEHYFVSTNCGRLADQISKKKADSLFAALERDYGIRHLDAEPRNITYSDKLGRFCIIDFELAEILPPPPGLTMAGPPAPAAPSA